MSIFSADDELSEISLPLLPLEKQLIEETALSPIVDEEEATDNSRDQKLPSSSSSSSSDSPLISPPSPQKKMSLQSHMKRVIGDHCEICESRMETHNLMRKCKRSFRRNATNPDLAKGWLFFFQHSPFDTAESKAQFPTRLRIVYPHVLRRLVVDHLCGHPSSSVSRRPNQSLQRKKKIHRDNLARATSALYNAVLDHHGQIPFCYFVRPIMFATHKGL